MALGLGFLVWGLGSMASTLAGPERKARTSKTTVLDEVLGERSIIESMCYSGLRLQLHSNMLPAEALLRY